MSANGSATAQDPTGVEDVKGKGKSAQQPQHPDIEEDEDEEESGADEVNYRIQSSQTSTNIIPGSRR